MKTTWAFQVRAEGDTVDIDIYDVVGDPWGDAPSAKDVLDLLSKNKNASAINLRINSAGGEVFAGLAMYNLLAEHKAKKTVYVDGLAASIASVVAMAGDEIVMADSAMMMIHNPWSFAIGDAADMRKTADFLDKVGSQLVGIYAARTGKNPDDIAKAMQDETWMTAAEAKAAGYATKVAPSKKAAARAGQSFDLSGFRHVPGAVIELASAFTGLRVEAKAVPYKEYPKHDDSSWNGAAAVDRIRKWASSDGSGDETKIDWGKYRNGFAWYDENNAEAFGSYKLPHHDVVDGAMVTSRAGTIAAGNAVAGSRGGTDIPEGDLVGVKTHLEKHYHQFDLKAPWEAKSNDRGSTAAASMGDIVSGASPRTPAASSAAPKGKKPMTKDELKAQHPELYASVLQEGVTAERKRASAHLKRGEAVGDPKIAIKAIAAGTDYGDPEIMAEYDSAADLRRDRANRVVDDAAAAAALVNPAAPKPNAAPAGAGDAVDQAVDKFFAARGQKVANG